MPYIVEMWCDGACRNNGRVNAYEPVVAGCGVYYPRCSVNPCLRQQYKPLEDFRGQNNPTATSNRAELHGVILALETAGKVFQALRGSPYLIVRIHMDSKYVVGALTVWHHKWERNGWRNAKGSPVANQDLLREALDLMSDIEEYGEVKLISIPREENKEADFLANEACDEAEELADDY